MKKEKKTHWLRNTLSILIGCVILGLILSGILFARDHNRTYAMAYLTFTFDGAQDGIAPNGYAFEINEIDTEEILTEALQNVGLDGRYNFEDLRPNLAVQGIYPDDLVSQMTKYYSVKDASSSQPLTLSEYHPTVFKVVLYRDFDPSISRNDLVKLLEQILVSYRNWFAQTYSMGTIDLIQMESLEEYDYFQQLETLKYQLQQAGDYAGEMAGKNATLQVGGKSFSDLSLQFSSLMSSDLNRLNATMTMNALSKDLDRLQGQYQFEIKELQSQVGIKTQMMNNLDTLISTYGKNGIIYLGTSGGLNKVDYHSSEVYDQLVDVRNDVADDIASINVQITDCRNKLENLNVGAKLSNEGDSIETLDDNENSTAEAMAEEPTDIVENMLLSDASTEQKKAILEAGITRLVEKSNSSISLFSDLIGVFNSQEINELTVSQSLVKFKAPSVFSGTFIILAIKTVGPICALGLIVALILIIISRRKEQKNAA